MEDPSDSRRRGVQSQLAASGHDVSLCAEQRSDASGTNKGELGQVDDDPDFALLRIDVRERSSERGSAECVELALEADDDPAADSADVDAELSGERTSRYWWSRRSGLDECARRAFRRRVWSPR
jgi:hypothetical protein